MSNSIRLGYTDAVRFLEYVHRTYRWRFFLLKNTFGLTPGYSPIPVEHGRHSLTYNIADLKSLAYKYAQGKIGHENIHKREREFMKKLNINHVGNDNDVHENTQEIESISLADRLDRAIGDIALIAKALYAVMLALGTVDLHGGLAEEELEALRRVTEDFSERAYQIVDTLSEIHGELFDDSDCPDLTDDDLLALMDAMKEGA